MGTMTFDLPRHLSEEAQAELERASVAGGQDSMPYATQVIVDDGHLVLARHVDESGCLLAPWLVPGAGRVMVSSATLMERLLPYQFTLELARENQPDTRPGLRLADGRPEHARDAYRANQTKHTWIWQSRDACQ